MNEAKKIVETIKRKLAAAAPIREFELQKQERAPTFPTDRVELYGVTVISRDSKAHEIRDMLKWVEFMQPQMHEDIVSIWCDSPANCAYIVRLKEKPANDVERDGWLALLSYTVRKTLGGCNGIELMGPGDEVIGHVDPNWVMDDPA